MRYWQSEQAFWPTREHCTRLSRQTDQIYPGKKNGKKKITFFSIFPLDYTFAGHPVRIDY